MSMAAECPWEVRHRTEEGEHIAWLQRCLLVGDFAPGKKASSFYVVDPETGFPADPREDPICFTCGKTPPVESLIAVEIKTKRREFLEVFRSGRFRWPPATDEKTCWWCNSPDAVILNTDIPICKQCTEHLRRF